MHDAEFLPRMNRFVGFLLFIVGLALIVYLPIVVDEGVLVQVVYIWAMTFFVAVGSLMMVGVSLWRIAKSFLIVLAFGLPWSFLLFLPLPTEIRLFPAVAAFVAILVYRYYFRKRESSMKPSEGR